MVTELTGLSVKTEEDILQLHKLCMDLGLWAGLPVLERIRFAAGIATHSNPYDSELIQVCFSLDEKDDQACLIVKIQNHSRNIQERIVQPIPGVPASLYQEFLHDNVVTTEKANRDLRQFNFALTHDLKNSLTKLKLTLSLLSDEEMTPVINNYFQIINRSAESLENIIISKNKVIRLGNTSPEMVKSISPADLDAEVLENLQKRSTKERQK